MYNSVKNPFTCTGVFRKVVLLKIPKNLQFTPNNFLKCLDCSLMQFFLSELHAKNYRYQPCAFLNLRKITGIMSAVEIQKQTLADSLCRIPALTSFVENFQEGLQVYLKRSPLQMFPKVAGKFQKKIGAAYENSRYSINFFMPMPKLPNGSSFISMKSCCSKRYIKIHGLQPSQPRCFFRLNKYFWGKNKTCI